jgi:hypothetical protein
MTGHYGRPMAYGRPGAMHACMRPKKRRVDRGRPGAWARLGHELALRGASGESELAEGFTRPEPPLTCFPRHAGTKAAFERVWFAITPPLPRGLSMPMTTGVIGGTPQVPSARLTLPLNLP